jgi:hypothetical protein
VEGEVREGRGRGARSEGGKGWRARREAGNGCGEEAPNTALQGAWLLFRVIRQDKLKLRRSTHSCAGERERSGVNGVVLRDRGEGESDEADTHGKKRRTVERVNGDRCAAVTI